MNDKFIHVALLLMVLSKTVAGVPLYNGGVFVPFCAGEDPPAHAATARSALEGFPLASRVSCRDRFCRLTPPPGRPSLWHDGQPMAGEHFNLSGAYARLGLTAFPSVSSAIWRVHRRSGVSCPVVVLRGEFKFRLY